MATGITFDGKKDHIIFVGIDFGFILTPQQKKILWMKETFDEHWFEIFMVEEQT